MIVQRYQNRKGEVVHIESEHEIELADIEWLIKNPKIDDVSAYPSRDDCKANQYLIYWGERANPNNSRIAQNHGKMCAILLDYDDGYTIDTFNAKFNGRFQYYIYTSFSHKPTHHKFRVIIPTTEPYEMTVFMSKVLKKCFPISIKDKETNEVIVAGSDDNTFNKRGFFEPVKVSEHYQYFISNGPIFDVEKRLGKMVQAEHDDWIANQRMEAQKREQMRVDREARGIPQATIEARKAGYIAKVIEPLMTSVSWGSDGGGRYGILGKAMVKMDKADFDMERFDDDEIYDVLYPYLRDKKHIANLEKYLRNRKY